jgi:hypothetical protein
VRARRLQAWVRNMMQPGQPRMSKSEWKRQLGSTKNLKNVKRHYKAQQKMQLQMQYERTTGDSVENWDDGKSVGRKEQVCVWDARARGKGGGVHLPASYLRIHLPTDSTIEPAGWLIAWLAGWLMWRVRGRVMERHAFCASSTRRGKSNSCGCSGLCGGLWLCLWCGGSCC